MSCALGRRQIERLQNMNTSGAREQLTKALADSELKLSELGTRIEQQDEVIENKLKMVSCKRSTIIPCHDGSQNNK